MTITTPRLPIARAFATSEEHLRNGIERVYSLLLRRAPSEAEVRGALPAYRQPSAIVEFLAQLLASPEYWQNSNSNPTAWVVDLYHDVLSRPPDDPGLSHWLAQLTTLSEAQTPRAIDGSGPGGEDWVQEEARNEQALASGDRPIVFLGDSITDWLQRGAGAPVWNQYWAPLGALNLAIAGLSTREVLWQVEQLQVGSVSPKVVVLAIGTNNLLYHHTPEQTAEAIVSCVQAIQDSVPGAQVVVQSLLPRGRLSSDPGRYFTLFVNQLVPSLLCGAHWLDVTNGWMDGSGNIPPTLLSDGLHPAKLGYDLWNSQAYAVIKSILDQA